MTQPGDDGAAGQLDPAAGRGQPTLIAMQIVFTVLVLILAVALSGVVTRVSPVKLPLPIFQIALGAVLALPLFGLHVRFDPDVFLLLFIPPLLFADGWRIPKREFFRLGRPILALALGLVLFTVVGVGYFIHWLIPPISLPLAFALGAVLSPTDALAVSAIAGKGKLPPKLQHLLEGEALMNDASGLVAFKFAIAAALTGVFSIWDASFSFFVIAIGGLMVGAATAWGFSYARRQVLRWSGDEPAIQVALLLLTPFAAYLFAEHFELSGILSAVAAGITMTYTDSADNSSSATRLQTNSVWAMLEFIFNGMTFILLGLQLPSVIDLAHADAVAAGNVPVGYLFGYVVAITLTLIVLRFFWVWVTQHLRFFRRIVLGSAYRPINLWLVLATALAGVRGSITMAGVMAVPLVMNDGTPFPARDLMIFLATGVILTSLVIASIFLPMVLPKLPQPAENLQEKEERRARLLLAKSAVAAVEQAHDQMLHGLSEADAQLLEEVSGSLLSVYRARVDAESELADTNLRANRHRQFERELRLAAVTAERNEIYRLRETFQINDETFRALLRDLDLAENWVMSPLVSKH
ncbi:CPA1 family monovalent cation:H+ antiporter [Pigmentiphaga litoralis]|uniref:CPA1 family monovalent cation:H+ antiporter n=2 Tax=Pigmentiphaga litoralis TaxID=516702 RepID=A0A7Y9LKQ6_9BURK|nr:CPA1 family monovalent cation:H+ antiporter [Pigmentiphaga litoralis]NYE83174.1 CPA1 family monovalent cation:H+ antiporter [Pigmentiphaga litoralis]